MAEFFIYLFIYSLFKNLIMDSIIIRPENEQQQKALQLILEGLKSLMKMSPFLMLPVILFLPLRMKSG